MKSAPKKTPEMGVFPTENSTETRPLQWKFAVNSDGFLDDRDLDRAVGAAHCSPRTNANLSEI